MTIDDIVHASILNHRPGAPARTFWSTLARVGEPFAASIGRPVEWRWLSSNLDDHSLVRSHETLDGIRAALRAFEHAQEQEQAERCQTTTATTAH